MYVLGNCVDARVHEAIVCESTREGDPRFLGGRYAPDVDRQLELAVRAVVRACYSARDDLVSFRERLLDRLGRAVPIEAAFFAAADPDTLLFTYASVDDPLASAGAQFLANEFGEVQDVNRFVDLARAVKPVATLDRATAGRRNASTRFREIMAPLGFGDELRVALRTGGLTWGFLCLHRAGKAGFTQSEIALVERVAPHAAEAIRRIVAEALECAGECAREAGVLLATDDCIVALTDAAAMWLEELGLSASPGDPVPLPLRAAVRRLEAIERGSVPRGPAFLKWMSRRSSLIEFHAARLRSGKVPATTAITIAPANPTARSDLRLAAYHLTPAQRRVAELVLQGRSTRQINGELGISEYTVQDHLKAVFDKVGVASRRELVAALLR
jgi:DNA-binding CsgD family transcriptional regulator